MLASRNIGARVRIRTRTCAGDALDVVPLLIGLHGRKLEPPLGIAHSRILLLNHTRKTGVPSRTFSSNLTLSPSTACCRAPLRANPEQEGASLRVEWVRTRPLCALSYGDKKKRNGTRAWWQSAKTGMPWTRTTLPFQGAHCLANRSGPLVRLTFQTGRRGETCTPKAVRFWAESVCCSRLTTRRSATRDLHPEGSAILSRRGLLFPLKPVAVRWWA